MKTEKVIDVHDLHVWTISTGMNALSGHLVVADQMVSEADRVVQAVNKVLSEGYGITHTTLQVEPEQVVSFKHGSNASADSRIYTDKEQQHSSND
jgi:Co/Zn/Cd efflux system component